MCLSLPLQKSAVQNNYVESSAVIEIITSLHVNCKKTTSVSEGEQVLEYM